MRTATTARNFSAWRERQDDAHHRARRAVPAAIDDRRVAAVGFGESAHDCQAESGAGAGPGVIAAGEAFEGVVDDVGRKAWPLVGDFDDDRIFELGAMQGDSAGA